MYQQIGFRDSKNRIFHTYNYDIIFYEAIYFLDE